ncbi:hypothetical protein G6020_14755 [Dietzia sp. B19]|uniref:cation transporter dimerization domain-containing protein n=1 Tax=Dietzia sp. B19 TaxID=1630632 RepID=UPI0015FA5D27|nr:cation transporter dimerization domain-containing protein [Dietzia sp. B19]MBB1058616.1 hypothetical protein [Dietzia sp. B19]
MAQRGHASWGHGAVLHCSDEVLRSSRRIFRPARSVETGRHRHIYLVMGVPGSWAVSTAHELADRLEDQVEGVFPGRDTHPCRAGGSTRLLLTPQCGCSRRADVHGLVV